MAPGNVNHFERLNDPTLVIIISLLPTEDAARYATLSRRWRRIWKFARAIEFIKPIREHIRLAEERLDFAKDWVIWYQQQHRNDEPALEVEAMMEFFICETLSDNLVDERWNDDPPGKDHVPSLELTSFWYEGILILSAYHLNVTSLRVFQTIREISLSGDGLTSDCLQWLIVTCMFLQTLSLKGCRNLEEVNISGGIGPRLTNLSIEDCSPLGQGITVSSETLQSFKYHGAMPHGFTLDLKNLKEGELNFRNESGPYSAYSWNADELHDSILLPMGAAKFLSVCSFVTQVISEVIEKDWMCLNLTHLKLKTAMDPKEFEGIHFMLDSCPNLEKLSVQIERIINLEGYSNATKSPIDFWNSPYYSCEKKSEEEESEEEKSEEEESEEEESEENEPAKETCGFRNRMTVVEMENFTGTRYELEFLKYLLRNGRKLQSMIIKPPKYHDSNGGNPNLYEQRAHELFTAEKASESAHILWQN